MHFLPGEGHFTFKFIMTELRAGTNFEDFLFQWLPKVMRSADVTGEALS